MRDTVAYADDPYAAYLSLVGKATKVGRAIPPGIAAVVREVVEDPRRREAATVLLLTEELCLPWELAVFDPPLDTPWGGVSPFLGAHAAYRAVAADPAPTTSHAAVLGRRATGRGAGRRLRRCPGLEPARPRDRRGETGRRAVRTPGGDRVATVARRRQRSPWRAGRRPAPRRAARAVRRRRGRKRAWSSWPPTPAARSGRPSSSPPTRSRPGASTAGRSSSSTPARWRPTSGSSATTAGFASTLLRIGATGVVAPLWNVDDDVAAEFARRFYAATWTATGRDGTLAPTSVAEAVRALRAQYTEAAAEAHTDGVTATLIAFQVFGHPRLRLAHV